MSADMIFQVTLALQKKLKLALAAALDPGDVFIGPLDDPDAKTASLILFLYRIAPNASMRNHDHRVSTANPSNPVIVFSNSLPLDLYFLVTVGTLPGFSEETLLKRLGIAMQALNQEPLLTGIDVNFETINVSLDPLSAEEMSRVWTLFPTANYRTSVAYLATPVWVDQRDPPAPAPRVVKDSLSSGQKARATENV
jgi:Pvc16 N-terminal domain